MTTASRKPLLTFLFVLAWAFTPLLAQETTVKGTVKDSEGTPLEGVRVTVGDFYTLSKADGTYRMTINDGANLIAFFTNFGYKPDTIVFSVKEGATVILDKSLKLLPNFLDNVDVIDKKARFENQIGVNKKDIEAFVGPGSDVEGIIKTLPGVSSYNELSSQYSVRGGNFDENLVYVNGIQVYRPFLVRNGQQEGLSFVNSQMVRNVKFSAGGFEARYGDKMSSVLDITYRQPDDFGMTLEGSLLGGNLVYEDRMFKKRLSAIVGARYRTNQILLGSLDTDADFRPRFTDVQAYLTYYLRDDLEISFLGNFSRNNYQVVPDRRTTDFGTFQEALRLEVFFDGKEDYDFTTRFGALSTTYRPDKELQLKFTTSAFQTTEQEYFDVIGAYRLGELNNNLGSDDFGEISFLRGIGGFQNYARNKLDAIVANFAHDGIYDKDEVTWRWGVKYQYEDIIDTYKEWERIDSAGFSVPNRPSVSFPVTGVDTNANGQVVGGDLGLVYAPEDSIRLFESFDSDAAVQSSRITAYVERTQLFQKNGNDFFLNLGLRTHYWTFNNQNVISPRASFSWKPDWKRDMVWRFSSGFYYQPAFYREMRDLNGGLNENIKAQQSIHFVLGNDYQLTIWNRPFKMVTEVYYKILDNLIPYDLDNVRIRYRAINNSRGYATGLDYRINGEFVQGVDSWLSMSVLSIQEDIEGDGAGYLPRPTDQRFNAKIFFQDYLPRDPTFRVSLTLIYGTGLPFGPPQAEPKDRNYRLPSYFRSDIGFSKVLKAEGKTYKSKFLNQFKSLWVGLEVFNLLARNNTVSYLWVKDISTAREYAVPNYLTGRLLNIKLVAKL
ncbi:MAG: TonB-dependent receptor [Owenweeksia sp.]|nr:TonB-dependent receptor [Owenweeksia sp.]|tara:strand:- start:5321 stop:7822 length:2502 start_codon:yes stop_codon:yes gene_type:complete